MSRSDPQPTLSPQGRGTGAQRQGEGRAKNPGDLLRCARAARQEMTEAEERLWPHLRGRRLVGFKFRRQHGLGRTRPDCLCMSAGLIAEVDGSQHIEQGERDARRTIILNEKGYRVLRVCNNGVLARMELVLEAILSELTAPHPGSLTRACSSPLRGEGA